MIALICSHALGNLLRDTLRDLSARRRLPWRCLACGTRADHTQPHYDSERGRLCHAEVVWDCDLPPP